MLDIAASALKLNRALGIIAGVASKTNLAMQIVRLENELKKAKTDHDRATKQLKEQEYEKARIEDGIKITEKEMQRRMCDF